MRTLASPEGAIAVDVTPVAATPVEAEPFTARWNLAELYPSLAAWQEDATRLDAQLAELAACKGRLGDDAACLRQCLDILADATKRFFRLAVFASEQLAEDTGNAASLELEQQTDVLGNRLSEASAFVEPEILRIGKDRIARFLAEEPALRIHRHPLDRVLRRAPHTLSDEGEALVAAFGLAANAGSSAYTILTNADMRWPTVRLSTGEEATLDHAAYTRLRESPVRADRKQVMDAFFGAFKDYERTIGVNLYSQLKEDAVHAKVRRYADSITHALDRHNVPVAVLDTLIAQANANLPTLHRYFRLRARLLGIPQLAYYDLYPPLVSGDYRFPFAEGRRLVLESVAPLGEAYVAAMTRGFDERWMDVYPRPRKLSGAHAAGSAYDVHPYVLLNYNDDYESVTTMAHEWGHAMHSHLANRAQPFVTANYATFVAEIASTFNEELLLQRMLRAAPTDDERLFYLGSALESLRATFFRQAMFAEFERAIHARVDRGEPASGETFTKIYRDILGRHHGTSEGVVAIDDAYAVEWAFIPHFYSAFYVYQYATSVAAASLFAQRVERGEPGALERYLGLLEAGGSDYPYELVKSAGVDLATPAPYQALLARMNAIMDEIEALLAKRT